MIDNFLRKLVYMEWEVRGKKVFFLDLLLLFCALFFGLWIRVGLGASHRVMLMDFLCAMGAAWLVQKTVRCLRRSLIAFTVLLFQPVFLLNGGIAGGKLHFWKDGGNPLTVGNGEMLSGFAPNIYQIIGSDVLPGEYSVAGVFFTLGVVCIALYCFRMAVWKKGMSKMKTALFFCVLIAFLMPCTDVSLGVPITLLAVLLAFNEPKSFYAPIVVTCCYFACQTAQLTGTTMVPLYVYSFLMLLLLVLLGAGLYQESIAYGKTAEGGGDGQQMGHPVEAVFFVAVVTVLGLAVRFVFKDVKTMDYITCLKPWVDTFKSAGSFKAIAGDFYNYTPTYMYILYGISRIPIEPLYPIKLVSLLFDFLLAFFSAGIVLQLTKSRTRSLLAYAIVFLLPTVAVNSGMWAQCDALYVTCIIISLYYILKESSHLSMLWFGMAFALKLQSLFVFPLYVFLWVKKKYRIEQFMYIPMMYLLMCIPSALAGKSIRELLLVYVEQGNTEPWMLSWNWPNIYLLFGPTNFYEKYALAGVIGTLAVLMLVLYYMVKKGTDTGQITIVNVMLMFALLVPYFLPYMHERYGYLADIVAVILFVVCPSRFYVAVAQILLSYTAYTGYLHGQSTVHQTFYCFVMTCLVISVTIQVLSPNKKILPDKKIF